MILLRWLTFCNSMCSSKSASSACSCVLSEVVSLTLEPWSVSMDLQIYSSYKMHCALLTYARQYEYCEFVEEAMYGNLTKASLL